MPSQASLSSGKSPARTLAQSALEDSQALLARAGNAAGVFTALTPELMQPSPRAPARSGFPPNAVVSIKDLFDLAGYVTTAGSRVMREDAPAMASAPVVQKLLDAGARIVGRTNMSEFAFSGMGLNPHYGTPGNPHDASRLCGGSSSGAAASVALGLCAVGLGSDTGGSVRIPAALCGLVGYKPTQSLVSRAGVMPLSSTLDSIGGIANSLSDLLVFHNTIATRPITPVLKPLSETKLLMPANFVWSGCDETVIGAFNAARRRLEAAGVQITEARLTSLDALQSLMSRVGFSAIEAAAHHARFLSASSRAALDPRVLVRLLAGVGASAQEYLALHAARDAFAAQLSVELAGFDALLCPTCPIIAPRIEDVESNMEAFAQANVLLLRNTTIANWHGGCSLSLPCPTSGLPVGLMLSSAKLNDAKLLGLGLALEPVLKNSNTTA